MSRPPRQRRLTPAEWALWREVTRSVDRRAERRHVAVEIAPGPPVVAKTPAPDLSTAFPTQPYAPPRASPPDALKPLVPLDRRSRQRVARGRTEIDAVLDLHGLRQADAHHRLRAFLRAAQQDDARLVLVVTGKGATTGGVLRQSVPHWLAAPDMRALVVGFEAAAIPHGGTGALYVRLRRG